MDRTILDEVGDLEGRLGLPKGFYWNLLRDDDWSFVIELNAMFEGSCTQVLAERLHAPELSGALAQLDFANTKFGKAALLRALGVITSEQETFLRTLAELLNDLVHNIAKVSFSFESYAGAMDANQLKTVVKNFGHGVSDTIEIASKRVPRAKFVRENPKLSLWITAAEILACLYVEFEVAALHLKKLALSELQELTAPLPISR